MDGRRNDIGGGRGRENCGVPCVRRLGGWRALLDDMDRFWEEAAGSASSRRKFIREQTWKKEWLLGLGGFPLFGGIYALAAFITYIH